jgi:hypothetical protein
MCSGIWIRNVRESKKKINLGEIDMNNPIKLKKETINLISAIRREIGSLFLDDTIINIALSRQLEFLRKEKNNGARIREIKTKKN